jgi:bacteriocin-like protein
MKNDVQIEIKDLEDARVGVELSTEELQAVSGGRWTVSFKCGPQNLADEWWA